MAGNPSARARAASRSDCDLSADRHHGVVTSGSRADLYGERPVPSGIDASSCWLAPPSRRTGI
jgi:hypothetical protein